MHVPPTNPSNDKFPTPVIHSNGDMMARSATHAVRTTSYLVLWLPVIPTLFYYVGEAAKGFL